MLTAGGVSMPARARQGPDGDVVEGDEHVERIAEVAMSARPRRH
jgi:hypothetical protein